MTLADWLAHCERLHPKTIELTLDRGAACQTRLGIAVSAAISVVGGTTRRIVGDDGQRRRFAVDVHPNAVDAHGQQPVGRRLQREFRLGQAFADRQGLEALDVLHGALARAAVGGPPAVYSVGGGFVVSGVVGIGPIGAFVVDPGQIYPPLTQLTNARVDVITALVSFERVFEVLDFDPLEDPRVGGLA